MRTRLKFCGMTNPDDALAAAGAGADAIGFVFYPPAATAVDPSTAATAANALPPFVSTVALFVDADAKTVHDVIRVVRPNYLQFHGKETADYCRQFNLPYIKACRVRNAADITLAQKNYPDSRAILLDTYVEGKPGGTGECFDWRLIPPAKESQPFIIAGGLTAANVGDLIRQAHPWGVDISGSIALDGNRRRKDWDKMTVFAETVHHAN